MTGITTPRCRRWHPNLEHVTSGFLMQEATAGLKLIDEMRSNVSKTRSEISMTFALNLR